MSSARLAELCGERRQELTRERGHLAEQYLEDAMAEPGEEQWCDSAHRYRPRRGIEQRQFAEVRAGGQLVNFPAVAQDGCSPFENDEERFTLVPFAYDVHPFYRFDDVDVTCHDSQITLRTTGEQRNSAKTLHGIGT